MTIFTPVPDPFPGKSPIPPGAPGFYKRAELLATVQELLRAGESVSLVGERKAGKTSFLNYLAANLSPDEFIPVYVDTQRVAPKKDRLFLGKLARSAAQAMTQVMGLDAESTDLTAAEATTPARERLLQLYELLNARFNLDELHTLCFYLGVDFDNLPAIGKADKARELVMHLQRRGRIADLVHTGRRLRSDIEWGDIPVAPTVHTGDPLPTHTLKAAADEAYTIFEEDLERLRFQLPANEQFGKRRLVWLIDEIEILRGYTDTELFSFLRPLAQSDPHFRMVVAGYDVLYTLSTRSQWSPFYNAFHHVWLDSLDPETARELVDDALHGSGLTIDETLLQPVMDWTGQKPFFLKWLLSKVATAVNQRQTDYHINDPLLQAVRQLFLAENNVDFHFTHLWQTHVTPRQQKILSVMAATTGPYTYTQIRDALHSQALVTAAELTPANLNEDLTRLLQLGFLYKQRGQYTFTSGCLPAWIAQNKSLQDS